MRRLDPPLTPADVVRSQARGQLGPLHCTYDAFWPHGPRNEAGDLDVLEAFILRHPTTAATKEQAASHEAGHSIAHERLGMMMHAAEITGPPFGRGGWGGTARYRELFYGPWRGEWYPDAMQRGATAMLAGPIAEELIGRGEALSSVGEVVAASVLVRRAAELLGRDTIEMWEETLLGAVALVEHHEPEILDIAAVLERKKRISRTGSAVNKILMRVEEAPIDMGSVSERGLALARRITEALREFAR
jgi:hypothetical protein